MTHSALIATVRNLLLRSSALPGVNMPDITDLYPNDDGVYEAADIKSRRPIDAYLAIGAGIILALAAFWSAFIG